MNTRTGLAPSSLPVFLMIVLSHFCTGLLLYSQHHQQSLHLSFIIDSGNIFLFSSRKSMYANVAIVVWVEATRVLEYKFVSLYLSWLRHIVLYILLHWSICAERQSRRDRKKYNNFATIKAAIFYQMLPLFVILFIWLDVNTKKHLLVEYV